jgi:hypothetical protein
MIRRAPIQISISHITAQTQGHADTLVQHQTMPSGLPDDDEACLFMLKSAPSRQAQGAMVMNLLQAQGRFQLLGVLSPHFKISLWGGEMASAHAVASSAGVGLLRSLVVDHGVDPNQRTLPLGSTALHMAFQTCRRKAPSSSSMMCDINARDEEQGATPIMLAAQAGLIGAVKALVARGARLDEENDHRQSALWFSIALKQQEAALCLLEAGAD